MLKNQIQEHIIKVIHPDQAILIPDDAGMVQHRKICQYNPPYKQTNLKKHNISLVSEKKKPFTSSNTLL